MCYDVASPLERPAVDGCGKGVVYYQRHAVSVSHLSKPLYVEYVAAWVGDGFTEETFRVWTKLCLDAFIIPFGVDEGAFYAEFA